MKKRIFIPVILSFVVIVWAGYIFKTLHKLSLEETIYKSFALFFANLESVSNSADVWYLNIYYPAILAILIVAYGVIRLYSYLVSDSLKKIFVKNGEGGVLVVGFGKGNQALINSIKQNNWVMVVDSDKSINTLEYKDLIFWIADARDIEFLKSLNIEKREYVVISTGNDLINLEIAKNILQITNKTKIYLQINDRSLRYFYDDKFLDSKITKIYSYYEASAQELFRQNDIYTKEILHSKKDYSIVVSGDLEYVEDIVFFAYIFGELPNENRLTIYLVANNKKAYEDRLKILFNNIDAVKNIKLKVIEGNFEELDIYKNSIFTEPNLTNVIFAYNDDLKNIKYALNLTNLVYLKNVAKNECAKKIAISIGNSKNLDEFIHNSQTYYHIKVFGQTDSVNQKNTVFNTDLENIAIGVDFVYSNIGVKLKNYETYEYEFFGYDDSLNYSYDKLFEVDTNSWFTKNYFDKSSSMAVALHIKTKLNYLGLRAIKANSINKNKIFKKNLELFSKHIEGKIALMGKNEHNRWNNFLFLNGFKKIDFISAKEKKEKKELHTRLKEHMCLVEFEDFKRYSNKLVELGYSKGQFEGFDILIVMHIPHILANAGYEIVEL